MCEYIPTTDEIQRRASHMGVFGFDPMREREFQAWLAAHNAEVAAKALEDAANAWTQGGWANDMPPRGSSRSQIILGVSNAAGAFLRARAAEYRKAVQ